ncbi:MAG: methylmalonyl-CoA mutase, partial [Candidatus Eremiobacteraeota bacterium]|nr:methylmalonyl-CoA mutase [Candidatus Eremiobacteraeota bacterium]
LSFYFVSQIDFLEEIAKFRAARRVWARVMKERFGAKTPESMRLRFHCQTAGASCTAREPLNNIARTAIEALAAVCGGAQSLHTNGYDEALSIPSESAMKIALRTQQIIVEETGVANTIDPLGGSYAIERLTSDIERGCFEYFDEIDRRGGAVKCIEDNYFQSELADAAFEFNRRKERHEFEFVGLTKYRDDSPNPPLDLHHVDEAAANRQLARLAAVKKSRDEAKVQKALDALISVAKTDENVMPATIEAVRVRATGGEIVNALRPIFGKYVEKPVF